jgi:hypothetical protein
MIGPRGGLNDMALDPDARRYADNLFQRDLERITREYAHKTSEIAQKHPILREVISSAYVAAIADSYADKIEALANAKQASLLTAYEKAGLRFDDNALQEISSEIQQFCVTQGNYSVEAVRAVLPQTYGRMPSPDTLDAAIARATGRIPRIVGDLQRELRIRRDEILLEERKLRRTYGAGLGKTCDVFICHASEDKNDFVRPLAAALQGDECLV